jgi:hypothetical protein
MTEKEIYTTLYRKYKEAAEKEQKSTGVVDQQVF